MANEYVLHPTSELAWVDLFNEWQRVAVDKAPTPELQVADILHKVEVEQVVAVLMDAYPMFTVTNLNLTPPTLYLDDAEGWRS